MQTLQTKTLRLLELLEHDEIPFGVCYSDEKPDGFGPKPGEILSREREAAGEIDWSKAFASFSCLIKNVWLARQKKKAAWISHEECGCMGGGFYAGVYCPYLKMNVMYVSTGVPGTSIEGEHYMPSPEAMRACIEEASPPLGDGKYCVLKPLDQFEGEESPLSVTFFARPEVLTGLHSLACYTAGNYNAVVSPFGAGCTSIIAWPLVYAKRGVECAVLGGFDVSARKYLKTDELTFSIPIVFYRKMLDAMEDSALTRDQWPIVCKKVRKSKKTWGKGE